MNTLTTGARFKVAGLFRAAYRWMRDEDAPIPPRAAPPPVILPAPPPTAKPPPAAPPATPPPVSQGEELLLPLQVVIDGLPSQLKTKVRQHLVGVQTLPLPLAQVMAQLPKGAVRISFGELRRTVPDVFLQAADSDAITVELPLGEILPRINLGKLRRRNDQQVVKVADEIVSPFSARGKGLTLVAPTKPQPALAPLRPVNPPGQFDPSDFAPRATVPGPPLSAATPFARRPPEIPGLPQFAATPAAPVGPATQIPFRQSSVAPPPKPASATPVMRAITPAAVPVPPPPTKPAGGNSQGIEPKAQSLLPATPVLEAVLTPASPTEIVQVPLAALISAWPQPVRLEIAQMGVVDSTVAFPVGMLEKGLRAGKVLFSWKLVRAWLRPVAPPHVSPHDATPLEIPLSLIAPLFVAQRNPAGAGQRKVAVDETIPNLFFSGAPPAATSGISNAAPVSAPVAVKTPDTSIFLWGDTDDSRPQLVETAAGPATPSTDFIRQRATPIEIVKRAKALDGVVGALVALPDGLKVASDVPAELNADTLAAFLPQLFGKVSQATKELRMGALNNLSFTVGNIPWKIYQVHSVYFAAFGRAGESLPKAQLAALAGELDRKSKTV